MRIGFQNTKKLSSGFVILILFHALYYSTDLIYILTAIFNAVKEMHPYHQAPEAKTLHTHI